MTVPVVGVITRKPPWRYMPEISATRFSVSGSLRPKIGLLLLLVLVVLSVCLLVVPLVTQLQADKRADLITLRRPSDVLIGEFLRQVRRSRPNLVFSPAGFSHVLYLLHTLRGNKQSGLLKYIDPQISSVKKQINKGNQSFLVDTTLKSPPEMALPPAVIQVALASGTKLNVPSNPSNQLSITNTNSLNLVIDNVEVSEEDFFVSSKNVKRIPMLGVRGVMKVAVLKDLTVIETGLQDGFSLTILLPDRVNRLGAVVDNIQEYLVSSRSSLETKNVLLKIPQFTIEDVHPSLPILESLGLKELVAGNLLSQEENVVNIPLTNITHSARIQLSKGKDWVSAVDSEATEAMVVCDRGFILNVQHQDHPLPFLTAIYSQPN